MIFSNRVLGSIGVSKLVTAIAPELIIGLCGFSRSIAGRHRDAIDVRGRDRKQIRVYIRELRNVGSELTAAFREEACAQAL